MLRDIIKRYIGPILFCILAVYITHRAMIWYDQYWNDRTALHSIIQMIQSGQIQVTQPKK